VFISAYISGLPNFGKEDVVGIFRYAKKREKTTILDQLIDPREKEPMERLTGLTVYTDYLILNNDEGELLTGTRDHKKQADALLVSGTRNTVIKLGKKGSYFKNANCEYEAPPFEVAEKDPTGAGDAFNGGFIYGSIKNLDIERILKFANIVGATAVIRLGYTAGVYELDKLIEMLGF
jgi:2-dehydro-3-deoxygluconokinase